VSEMPDRRTDSVSASPANRGWATHGGRLVTLLLLVNSMVACTSALGEDRWLQFHGDGPNRGFVLTRTNESLEPDWSVEVGAVTFGSPVVAEDGTVYVGTVDGDLVSVDPDGTIKWRLTLPSPRFGFPAVITSSPAVGSDQNIYVVSTNVDLLVRDHTTNSTTTYQGHLSALHSVTPEGEVRWSHPFNERIADLKEWGFTGASPKVWGSGGELNVFLPVTYGQFRLKTFLSVLDSDGNLVAEETVASYDPTLVGTGPNLFEAIWDLIHIEFDTSGIDPPPGSAHKLWLDPTIAVVDDSDAPVTPTLVIHDNVAALGVFEWSAPSTLTPRWKIESKRPMRHSSPVILGDLLIIGREDGILEYRDLATGAAVWEPWPGIDGPAISTPAAFGRPIFARTSEQIYALDLDGELLYSFDGLTGYSYVSSPALSTNRVYVSTYGGLYSFNLDLSDVTKFDGMTPSGSSSPAIAEDGAVYQMDSKGKLWAFRQP